LRPAVQSPCRALSCGNLCSTRVLHRRLSFFCASWRHLQSCHKHPLTRLRQFELSLRRSRWSTSTQRCFGLSVCSVCPNRFNKQWQQQLSRSQLSGGIWFGVHDESSSPAVRIFSSSLMVALGVFVILGAIKFGISSCVSHLCMVPMGIPMSFSCSHTEQLDRHICSLHTEFHISPAPLQVGACGHVVCQPPPRLSSCPRSRCTA
jgi:hypothetical protein